MNAKEIVKSLNLNLIDHHQAAVARCNWQHNQEVCDEIEYEHQRLVAEDMSEQVIATINSGIFEEDQFLSSYLEMTAIVAYTMINIQYEEPSLSFRTKKLISIWKETSCPMIYNALIKLSKHRAKWSPESKRLYEMISNENN